MVSSGTEAAMSTIRLARGFTGRDKIVKFFGGYHGHADLLLVKAGLGAATFGVSYSPGGPGDFARQTLTAEYNSLESVKDLVSANKGNVACVIVEPIAGTVPPRKVFLEGLRSLCTDEGIVLIFYRELAEKSARLSSGIAEAAKKTAFPTYSTRAEACFARSLPAVRCRTGRPPPSATPMPFARFSD
jgi:hypothetical protein